jgi:hypothetical protein
MSTNLIVSITQILSSNILTRLASSLGLDKAQVDRALEAGVPGLLAAVSSLVSTSKGATALSTAVAQQQPGVLSSLASTIGGSGQKALIDTGASALTSLLGGTTMSALTSAVGQYAGIGDSSSKSLMGLLGPVVMGVLGQQQRASGLDASGLASLLSSQKDNILRSLPADFSRSLGETGILDSRVGSSDVRRASASTASRGSDSPGRHAAASKPVWGLEAPSSRPNWLIPCLALLAAGGLAWYLLSRPSPTETAVVQPPAKIESPLTTGALPESRDFASLENLRGIKVGDVDFGAQVANAVNGLRSSLEGITDETSAKSAMAPLEGSIGEFNKLAGMLGQLSPQNRQSLANAITATKPMLDRLFDKALQVPGVSALIKPSIDSIRTELNTMATA